MGRVPNSGPMVVRQNSWISAGRAFRQIFSTTSLNADQVLSRNGHRSNANLNIVSHSCDLQLGYAVSVAYLFFSFSLDPALSSLTGPADLTLLTGHQCRPVWNVRGVYIISVIFRLSWPLCISPLALSSEPLRIDESIPSYVGLSGNRCLLTRTGPSLSAPEDRALDYLSI